MSSRLSQFFNFIFRNGTDPSDCKLRPDEGLGAIGELSPGSFYTPAATSGDS